MVQQKYLVRWVQGEAPTSFGYDDLQSVWQDWNKYLEKTSLKHRLINVIKSRSTGTINVFYIGKSLGYLARSKRG